VGWADLWPLNEQRGCVAGFERHLIRHLAENGRCGLGRRRRQQGTGREEHARGGGGTREEPAPHTSPGPRRITLPRMTVEGSLSSLSASPLSERVNSSRLSSDL